MGTNYYVAMEACPHCGRGDDRLHIGKSSAGWEFLFAPYPENGLTSWRAWKTFLKNRPIVDEYGQPIDLYDLECLIEAKRGGYTSRTAPASVLGPSERRHIFDDEGYQFSDTADFS